ncbi:MAG TPA: FAD-dependent oxidoreductase [Candidatus Portnoybacteria bacterium]|nr:FAD-dependent oxidoreductase [Candidatus Portnoybacteria bacterium]HPH51882.1 FAD-dependent oxidoreductase [Candidatus Portnoybacteria bacterium]HPM28290.1 FAD-dependent oxidoreductase [Candidatus Portnoybacteria bacterium]
MKNYDLIIIGAGPAGVSAGIYAKNFGIKFLIIGETSGGTINTAYKVENYPGIFNVTGKELGEKFKEHLNHLQAPIIKERVNKILQDGDQFKVISENEKYSAKTIILALGTETKKLEIKNINKFEQKGVSYCSKNCVSLFKQKNIVIVGGANAAVMGAVMLAEEAEKIYLVYRKDKLRADDIWIKRAEKLKNIEIIFNVNVVEVNGKNWLEEIILDNGNKLQASGLIIEAGSVPNTVLLEELGVEINEFGFIKVDEAQKTNIKGIFAAGDITTGSNNFRQVVTAVSEGAIATLEVFKFLNNKK